VFILLISLINYSIVKVSDCMFPHGCLNFELSCSLSLPYVVCVYANNTSNKHKWKSLISLPINQYCLVLEFINPFVECLGLNIVLKARNCSSNGHIILSMLKSGKTGNTQHIKEISNFVIFMCC
jgi:hypothetical protein